MKKILFRKLITDYSVFFLIALFSASIIVWVFQAVNFLDIMIEDGRDYIVYVNYSLLNFPKIITKLIPFVLFFSLFYVILKYENNNELMIFWNFGINKIQLINFIFKFSLIFMIIQIILTSLIVPKTQDMARSFLRNSTVNFFGNFIKPQKFNDTIKGVTIFSEKKNQDGSLQNIYIKREIENNYIQITYAERGVFKEINNIPKLVLFNGETITEKNNKITVFSFSKSDFLLDNSKSNTTTDKKTQELKTLDLFKCILNIQNLKSKGINKIDSKIENCSFKNISNIFKEIYKRIIIPIYIPILMMLPLLLITSSKENINYSKIRVFTFLFGLFTVIISESTIRLISESILRNYSLTLVPIIILIILYSLFLKKFVLVGK